MKGEAEALLEDEDELDCYLLQNCEFIGPEKYDLNTDYIRGKYGLDPGDIKQLRRKCLRRM